MWLARWLLQMARDRLWLARDRLWLARWVLQNQLWLPVAGPKGEQPDFAQLTGNALLLGWLLPGHVQIQLP